MKSFWDERYSETDYVYGEEPNLFLAEKLKLLPAGNILFPCEGEGRNAVFAALKGWKVSAFDASEEGKNKALKLADKKGVTIHYDVNDAATIAYPENSFDIVAFIFAHFSPDIRGHVHQKAISWLKPGGKIILEAFNQHQLQNSSGGPKNLTMLYTLEMIKEDFTSLDVELLENASIILNEGKYHEGKADVIRLIAHKKI